MTALDDLAAVPFHAADTPDRARMMSRLADTELVVALTSDPIGDRIDLRLFALEGGPVAMACDAEDRLTGFLGGPVAYAAMPGRTLAALLLSGGAGLLVNPGHPSEMLLDAATLGWLTGALSGAPAPVEALLRLGPPAPDTVAALAEPLARRLADMRGLVAGAALAGTGQGHLLLIAGADPAQQPAIAKALAETLAFLPPQPGGVDVGFSDRPVAPGLLRFDLSPPDETGPGNAGPDPRPARPPILR